MEQNSTQESDMGTTPDTTPETPETVATDVAVGPVETDKKTTIQVFKSTTEILLAEKRGNDTYDDVIRRDRTMINTLRKKHPEIYTSLAGPQ